jgi:hypothetical protein
MTALLSYHYLLDELMSMNYLDIMPGGKTSRRHHIIYYENFSIIFNL